MLVVVAKDGYAEADRPVGDSDLMAMLQTLLADRFKLVSHRETKAVQAFVTATVTVWDDDISVADEKLRLVEKVIQGRDFTCMVESVNAVEAWLGSLPGHVYANVRQPPVSTLNIAHMIPLSAVWAGPARDEHLGAESAVGVGLVGLADEEPVLDEGVVGILAELREERLGIGGRDANGGQRMLHFVRADVTPAADWPRGGPGGYLS
jgi:hypothetical protein